MVPSTAMPVFAEELQNDAPGDESGVGDETTPENLETPDVPEPTEDELTDEEKAAAEEAKKAEAAKQTVADAKSKAEEAKTKAEGAQIKQDTADAVTLLEEAAAKLEGVSEDTEGYADAQAAIDDAAEAIANIDVDNLPETLFETPEGNGDLNEEQEPALLANTNLDEGIMPLAAGAVAISYVVKSNGAAVEDAATVTYTAGAEDDGSGGKVTVASTDVEFTVATKNGYKLVDVQVGSTTVTPASGKYSIENSNNELADAQVITVNVEPVKASYSVTGGTVDSTGVALAAEEGANNIEKTTPTAIDPAKPVAFKVTGVGGDTGLRLSTVEYQVGSGAKETLAAGDAGVYSIESLAAVNDDIAITVTVADAVYPVKAPAAGANYGLTWEVKGPDDGAAGATATLKKGQNLTATATLSATSSYSVTRLKKGDQNELTWGSNQETLTFEFTDVIKDSNKGADGTYDITSLLDIQATKVQAPVTIEDKDADSANGYTVEWAYADANDDSKAGTYKALSGTSFAPDKNQKVFLKVKAKTGYVIKGVTKKSGAITVSSATADDDGNTVVTFTATPPTDNTEANANVISVQAAKQSKVLYIKLATGAQVKSVRFQDSVNTTAANAVKTASGWEARSENSGAQLVITPADHYEIVAIHKGTGAHKTDGTCDHDDAGTNADGVITTTAVDMSAQDFASETYTIYTEKITVPYALVADETSFGGAAEANKITFTVEDESGRTISKEAAGDNAGKYVLDDGSTYRIKVTGVELADIEGFKKDYTNGTNLPYNADLGAFLLKADANTDSTDAKKTVTLKKAAATGLDVGFDVAGSETGLQVAQVKLNTYKQVTAGAVADAPADASFVNVGGGKAAEGVLKGSALSFTLQGQNAFKIKEVKVLKSDNITEVPFTVSGAVYTIPAVTEALTVKVATQLDPNKAHTITLEGDENVTFSAPNATTAANIEKTDDNKTIYVVTSTAETVTVTYTVAAGYTTDKVTANGVALDPTPGGSFDVTFAATDATKQTKNYKITTKEANAVLEDDKFVKFSVGDDVTLQVTEPASLVPVSTESGITYKLAADVMDEKDPSKVKTPGVHELRFDLLVPYGKKLGNVTGTAVDNNAVQLTAAGRVKSADGDFWVHSYKVVASQVSGTTKETADTVTIAAATDETISLSKAASSKDFNIKNNTTGVFGNFAGATAKHGQKITLQIAAGQTLEINGEAKNVDEDYLYTFYAELDDSKAVDGTTYEINVKENAAYQLKYEVVAKGGSAPADDSNATKADENKAVETNFEDSVYVFLQKVSDDSAVSISGVEVTEGAKSTTKVADAQDGAGQGKATIVMKDESYTVKFYTEVTETVGSISTKKKVLAATINLTANLADGKTLTVNGIKDNGTVKLEATGVAYFPMTLKAGRDVLDITDNKYNLSVAPTTEAEKAKAVAIADIDAKGNLVIKTLKGEGTESFQITAPGMEKPLLTFTVEGKQPDMKLKSIDSSAQGVSDIMINVTPNAKEREVNSEFKLFYEVTVEKVSGTSASTGAGVYYLPATAVKDGGKVTAAASRFFKVNKEAAAQAGINTFSFSARLVAVDKETMPAANDSTAGTGGTKLADSAVKFASAELLTKEFSTRTGYYEDKLSVTKKNTKLFSGQSDVVVAVPKFSSNAGYITGVSCEVLKRDGTSAAPKVTASYDEATMSVKVSAQAVSAGNYDVMIYALSEKGDRVGDGSDKVNYEMYRATAKLPITVQKGIEFIELAEQPSKVAMLADSKGRKKDVSFTLKPTGAYNYENGKLVKAQSQKFRYEFTGLNAKNTGMVTAKGNKITVSKNFVISNDPDNNTFTINLIADDYHTNRVGGGSRVASWEVTVTDKALEIGKVQMVDTDGKALPSTVSTLDLIGAELNITDRYGENISNAVTVTPNKGSIYAWNNNGTWRVGYNKRAKSVTFKATATDGGKNKADSIKYTVNYPSVAKYGIAVDNDELESGAVLDWTSATSCTFHGKGNDLIDFTIKAYDSKNNVNDALTNDYNYSVKVSGGKNLSSKSDVSSGIYKIQPSAAEVKVVITDKEAKKTYTYTLKNTNWSNVSAPKASTKDKLYNVYYAVDPDGAPNEGDPVSQEMTYTVKKAEAYNRVRITEISDGTFVGGVNNGGIDGTDVYRIENGVFKLNVTPKKVGTAKYSVVYGVDKAGNFVPQTKVATLTIKNNKVSNPKATNKYNINPNESWGVKLNAKPVLKNSTQGRNMVYFEAIQAGNIKGKMNRFTEFFELDPATGSLRIRSTVQGNPEKMAELIALAADKEGKKNLEGYLVYKYNNIGTGAGNTVTKIEKITVTMNDKKTGSGAAYTATDINIAAAANVEAKTTVKANGEALSLAQVMTDTAGWTASFASTEEKNAGTVTLRANGTPASGNVDLYVIPTGSRNENEAAPDKIKEVGIKVTVKVNVQTNGSKVTITKTAKEPAAALSGNVVQLTVSFTKANKDFAYVLDNAQINGAAKADNADDRIISVAYTAADEGTITLVLNRDKINPTNTNTVVNVPVKVSFTAGEEETVTFPVKLKKALTLADVKSRIESALNNLPVGSTAFASGAGAATAVGTKLTAITAEETMAAELTLAGISAGTPAAAADYDTSHKVEITLTDATLTGDAATTKAVVTVTDKEPPAADPENAAAAITALFARYQVPDKTTGKVDEGKLPITKSMDGDTYGMKNTIKNELDKYWAGKFVVTVDNVVVTMAKDFDANGDQIEVVKNMSVTYSVKNVVTGLAEISSTTTTVPTP